MRIHYTRPPEIPILGYFSRLNWKYRSCHSARVQSLSTLERIVKAREGVRKLLVDGQIVLKPNAKHTAVVGEVSFLALGTHLLEIAGIRRAAPGARGQKTLVKQPQDSMVAGVGFEPTTFGL